MDLMRRKWRKRVSIFHTILTPRRGGGAEVGKICNKKIKYFLTVHTYGNRAKYAVNMIKIQMRTKKLQYVKKRIIFPSGIYKQRESSTQTELENDESYSSLSLITCGCISWWSGTYMYNNVSIEKYS